MNKKIYYAYQFKDLTYIPHGVVYKNVNLDYIETFINKGLINWYKIKHTTFEEYRSSKIPIKAHIVVHYE